MGRNSLLLLLPLLLLVACADSARLNWSWHSLENKATTILNYISSSWHSKQLRPEIVLSKSSHRADIKGTEQEHAAAIEEAVLAGLPTLDVQYTTFNPSGARVLPRLAEDSALQFDLEQAKLLARFTSVAYCSDVEVISSWNCSRCQRIPGFEPYEVSWLQ